MPHKTGKIRHAYKSKYNLKRENQVILLLITDGKKWHYSAVKKLSTLLKGITSKHNGDFYCLNYFQSYTAENKLKKHKKYERIMIIAMEKWLKKDNKILKYNHREKKVPFIIYADLESLLEKMNSVIIILKNHQQLK